MFISGGLPLGPTHWFLVLHYIKIKMFVRVIDTSHHGAFMSIPLSQVAGSSSSASSHPTSSSWENSQLANDGARPNSRGARKSHTQQVCVSQASFQSWAPREQSCAAGMSKPVSRWAGMSKGITMMPERWQSVNICKDKSNRQYTTKVRATLDWEWSARAGAAHYKHVG